MYWRFLLNVARSFSWVVYISWQWATALNLQFLSTAIWSRLFFAIKQGYPIQEDGRIICWLQQTVPSFPLQLLSVPLPLFLLQTFNWFFFVKAHQSARGSVCCGESFWIDLWEDPCVLRGHCPPAKSSKIYSCLVYGGQANNLGFNVQICSLFISYCKTNKSANKIFYLTGRKVKSWRSLPLAINLSCIIQ